MERPDPKNPDAHTGPAGEGVSDSGSDAWYHTELLGTDEEDDAAARKQTAEREAEQGIA